MIFFNSNLEYNGNFKYGVINGNCNLFLIMEIILMEKGKIIFLMKKKNFEINNIIYKCKFRNVQLYEKEIENGNYNLNDDINLNNIKFQNENDYIGYILNFNNSSSNSVGNKYMNN